MRKMTEDDLLAPLTGSPAASDELANELTDDLDATAARLADELDDALGAAAARLAQELSAHAHRQGLLDVAYRTLDSPLGTLLLATTEVGLVRIAFEGEGEELVLTELSERVSPRVLNAPPRLDAAARQLEAYFAGQRRRFELPLDMRLTRGFRRSVLKRLTEVPFGATTSYAALARRAGSPRAVRATGSACATNPLPLLIPCHRVLRSDGGLGGYRGGVEVKRTLLALEETLPGEDAQPIACGRGAAQAQNSRERRGARPASQL